MLIHFFNLFEFFLTKVGLNFKDHYSEPQENDGQTRKAHIHWISSSVCMYVLRESTPLTMFESYMFLFIGCLGILAYCLTLVFMVFAIRGYNKGLNDKSTSLVTLLMTSHEGWYNILLILHSFS